jgi:hypothetical protein
MDFDWSCLVSRNLTTVSSEDLQQFEGLLGYTLPDDYRNFLLQFNGGKVNVDHDIPLQGEYSNLYVNYFSPFPAPRPSIGIIEARDVQVRFRLCLRQAIEIADDMGTGFYYLILSGEKRGAVYFIWKDGMPMLSPSDWEASETVIPAEMVEVSPTFDALGQIILAHWTPRVA